VALLGDHDVVVGIVLHGEEQRHVASGEAQMPPLRSQSRLRVLSLIETGASPGDDRLSIGRL
jgi:hypothetical protein